VIDALNVATANTQQTVVDFLKRSDLNNKKAYDVSIAKWLLSKWNIEIHS